MTSLGAKATSQHEGRDISWTRSFRLFDNGVCQRSDAFDFDRNAVTRLEEDRRLASHSHPMWCTGQDDGPGCETRARAEELDQRGYVEYHVAGAPILHRLPIEHRLDGQGVRVGDFIRGYEARPQWTEGGKGLAPAPLPAAPVHLPVSVRSRRWRRCNPVRNQVPPASPRSGRSVR